MSWNFLLFATAMRLRLEAAKASFGPKLNMKAKHNHFCMSRCGPSTWTEEKVIADAPADPFAVFLMSMGVAMSIPYCASAIKSTKID